jgi:outer membrane protein
MVQLLRVVVVIVLISVAVFAGAAGVAAQQAPAPAPAGPVLQLSMGRAVEMALESNLGLEVDRMPQGGTSVSRGTSRSVPNDFTQGSADISSERLNVGSSIQQFLPFFGTRYNLSWNNNRNTQDGGNPLFNPFLQSQFGFQITQPLWRGLVTDPNRAALTTSQRQRVIADVQLEQQVTRLEATVRNAYLDLISAIQALRVAQQNLEIVQTSLANARARVEVGAAAPIELISAEAEVASNQERVLVAEASIATREDILRTLVLDPNRPDYWQVQIVPTDTIQAEPRAIDLPAAIENARTGRLDLLVARRNMEIQDLQVEVSRDATRPDVNFNVAYTALGNGGTRFTYGSGFPPPVVGRDTRSYSAVLGDTFGGAYPNWSVGVSASYPIGRSAQDANLARAEVSRRQGELGLRQLEIAVVQQVRDAARQVENSARRSAPASSSSTPSSAASRPAWRRRSNSRSASSSSPPRASTNSMPRSTTTAR